MFSPASSPGPTPLGLQLSLALAPEITNRNDRRYLGHYVDLPCGPVPRFVWKEMNARKPVLDLSNSTSLLSKTNRHGFLRHDRKTPIFSHALWVFLMLPPCDHEFPSHAQLKEKRSLSPPPRVQSIRHGCQSEILSMTDTSSIAIRLLPEL